MINNVQLLSSNGVSNRAGHLGNGLLSNDNALVMSSNTNMVPNNVNISSVGLNSHPVL